MSPSLKKILEALLSQGKEREASHLAYREGIKHLSSKETAAALQTYEWLADHFPKSRLTSLLKSKISALLQAKKDSAGQEFFSKLSKQDMRNLISISQVRVLKDREIIFREGDEPLAFYTILQGQVDLNSSWGFKAKLESGDFFGEIALLTDTHRTATARASGLTKVLVLTQEQLQAAMKRFSGFKKKINEILEWRLFSNACARSKSLSQLKLKDLERIYQAFHPKFLRAKETLFREGDESLSFYILTQGLCEISTSQRVLARLGPGEIIGEMGLLHKRTRTATVRAASDSHLLECSASRFNKMLIRIPRLQSIVSEIADKRSEDTQIKTKPYSLEARKEEPF